MQKWEYLQVVARGFGPDLLAETVDGQIIPQETDKKRPMFYDFANKLGVQGWEMCGIAGSYRDMVVAYFRRPLA